MHIVFQEDQDEANEIMLAHFADPTTPFRTLTRYRHLDGSTRWARIQGMAVRNEDGVPYRLLGANIDVTDLILANQELQSTNDALVESNAALLEAQQANDLLAAYTNVAAHDLRSPARKVLQFASRLRRAEGELSERGEQSLQRIEAAANQLLTVVDGVRMLGRLTHDARPSEETDLAVTMRHVAGSHADALAEIDATVTIGTLPIVRGNPSHWQIALDNLLRNAMDHRASGRPLRVRLDADGDRIAFTDNGVGFPDGDLDGLFELFTRGDNSSPGSGIGLALVQRVAHRFGYHWSAQRGSPGARLVLDLGGRRAPATG
jgi:signal transduction histidine kinase